MKPVKGACLTTQQNLKRDFPELRVIDLCPVCEVKIGFHVSEPTTGNNFTVLFCFGNYLFSHHVVHDSYLILFSI